MGCGKIFPNLNTMAACLAQIGGIVLETGSEYMEEDCSIRPTYRAGIYSPARVARFKARG